MAKTKPIGVRFDENLSKEIFEQEGFTTYQAVLTFLENYYVFSNFFNSSNDRNNPFINAARGRDENGINNDEIKSTLKSIETKKESKVNSSFDNKSGFPIRKNGESSLDYKLRCIEYSKNKQQ